MKKFIFHYITAIKLTAISEGFRLAFCVVMVFSALLLVGCTTVENDGLPAPLAGSDITISTGTQGFVRQLDIGLGSTRQEDYIDASGMTRHRLVAGLSLHIAGPPATQKYLEVYVGQTVEFESYTLYVKEISKGSNALVPGASTGHVRLVVGFTVVEKAEPPSPITGTEITIPTGTQSRVKQLNIGLMYTREEDYTDASGTQHRLVARLSLHSEEPTSAQKYMDVRAGETVEFKNYTLYVKEISTGGIALAPGAPTGHVQLIVQ